MSSSKCGAENPEWLKFREQRATRFEPHCAKCGFENSPGVRFCRHRVTPLFLLDPGRPPGKPLRRLCPSVLQENALPPVDVLTFGVRTSCRSYRPPRARSKDAHSHSLVEDAQPNRA